MESDIPICLREVFVILRIYITCLKAIYIKISSDLCKLHWRTFSLNMLMCCYLCATQRKAKASSQILIFIWCIHMRGQFRKPSEMHKFSSLFPLFGLITMACNIAGAMEFCGWGMESDISALCLLWEDGWLILWSVKVSGRSKRSETIELRAQGCVTGSLWERISAWHVQKCNWLLQSNGQFID